MICAARVLFTIGINALHWLVSLPNFLLVFSMRGNVIITIVIIIMIMLQKYHLR